MRITKTEQGWTIDVPDEVITALALSDGQPVTIRPVPRPEDEARHWMDEMRGRLPDHPFDRWGWEPSA